MECTWVLPMFVWVLWLLPTAQRHAVSGDRFIGNSRMPVGVSANGCLYLCVRLATCPGCILPGIGSPVTLKKDNIVVLVVNKHQKKPNVSSADFLLTGLLYAVCKNYPLSSSSKEVNGQDRYGLSFVCFLIDLHV